MRSILAYGSLSLAAPDSQYRTDSPNCFRYITLSPSQTTSLLLFINVELPYCMTLQFTTVVKRYQHSETRVAWYLPCLLVTRQITGVRSGGGGGQGGHVPPPPTFQSGGQRYVCAPTLSDPEFRDVPPPPILSRSYAIANVVITLEFLILSQT